MQDLKRRLWSSSISILFVVLSIAFAWTPGFSYLVASLVAIMGVVGLWEYQKIAEAKGAKIPFFPLALFGFLVIFSFFWSTLFAHLALAPLILLFLALLCLFGIHFRNNDGAVIDIATGFFPLLYIAAPLGMLLGVLYFDRGSDGRWWVAYLLAVTKITDVGAYFAGTLLGKRKLAPHISPHKTIEGALTGLFSACMMSFLFHLMSRSTRFDPLLLGSFEWIVLGLLLGAAGQFGDLSESLLKRDANKKDSNSIPGLGGVLDAIDSLLFTVPIIYCYLYFLRAS